MRQHRLVYNDVCVDIGRVVDIPHTKGLHPLLDSSKAFTSDFFPHVLGHRC